MKRKLDEFNNPVESMDKEYSRSLFSSFGLDSRLIQAIADQGFSSPTLVQSKAIPLALEGKDILARAKTGSGKTAAYVIPILESILRRKATNARIDGASALILVPTRELAQQVFKVVAALSIHCAKNIRSINITQKVSDAAQRSLLAELPDIIIATPGRASSCLNSSAISFASINHLVVDEADLVFSYGYDEDMRLLANTIPKGSQTFLMSATLSTEIETLKGLFCHDAVALELDDEDGDSSGVNQYVVRCGEDEKFLLAYVIFKLKLIKGKCIIFVGDIDRCYRLKLFFEQFGIRSCVLNSELPVNSRIHVVEEYNKNVYEIIIATDDHEVMGEVNEKHLPRSKSSNDEPRLLDEDPDHSTIIGESADLESPCDENALLEKTNVQDDHSKVPPKKKKLHKKDKEFGISRGIDFQNVACILNFDLPMSSKSYIHRIGRTARAGKSGIAISFVIPAELYHKHKPTTLPSAKHDEEVFEKIMKSQNKMGKEIHPYHFDMKQVDVFRYRMTDALRAVTRIAVREARTRELKQELIKSEKLKRHFEENPEDLRHLRHDGELHTIRVRPHLKHVPDYLMPNNGKIATAGGDVGFIPMRKTTDNRIRKARMRKSLKGKKKAERRKADPLQTFNAKRRS